MDVNELKAKILSKISEEELNKLVREKIEEFGGLLNEEGAISLIAKEMGIEFDLEEEDYEFTINDITEGQRNVEVTGRIMNISEIRTFKRKDGTEGKLRSIEIADNTGTIRLTLWDDKVELADGLKVGDVVKVENAYSRKWRDRIELNSSADTKIDKLTDYDEEKYPQIKDIYKISELIPNITAKFEGEVVASYGIREFDRKDGSKGRLKSFILKDNTGSIRVTLWDDMADIEVNRGDYVRVEGYVREGPYGLEASANSIEILKKGEKIVSKEVDIENLPNYENEIVTVRGRVMGISNKKTVDLGDTTVEVQELYLEDETGRVRISFWRGKTNALNGINEGDLLKVTNCKVKLYTDREGYQRVDLIATAETEIVKDESISAPEYKENLCKIRDIVEGNVDKNDITVIGRVYRVFEVNEFEREGGIGKVRNVIIEDETGRIRLVLWDENADLDIKEGDVVKVVYGYVRERGEYVDLNIGRFGRIIVNPEGITIKSNRKFIADVEDGEDVEIRGTIVDYVKQGFVLYLCPNCRRKVVVVDDRYSCPECGDVTPDEVLTLTLVVDDGTGTITCRLYNRNVEKLTKKSRDELINCDIDIIEELLGEEFVFNGVIKKRDTLEMNVKNVREINLDEEINVIKSM
ncbi:OB-fold nucleic acid binding domain-containing protein [Methanotorris igneus]|uniref:Nucleic acid binding OB-fold tRNA/helicase-type n=1 Tax=Methanotorris igneus (strain DSM 5666 / JCM 11834 / Kol 5) TaxID=880724 RepID=F6BAS3_METIK|nr:OB-fold nucleic acid binding domain-containing protein [Methanotorris igneus]AEF95887.1 nucleic acid binding OB-fold tRNA/helicase-type [Methanotorris igneus Kol 5]